MMDVETGACFLPFCLNSRSRNQTDPNWSKYWLKIQGCTFLTQLRLTTRILSWAMVSDKMIPFWFRGQRIISFAKCNSSVILINGELWQLIRNHSFTKKKKSGFGLKLKRVLATSGGSEVVCVLFCSCSIALPLAQCPQPCVISACWLKSLLNQCCRVNPFCLSRT